MLVLRHRVVLAVVLMSGAVAMLMFSTDARSATPQQIFANDSSGMLFVRSSCDSGHYTGSGFLVGPRLMITALHVVQDADGTACSASVQQEGTGATSQMMRYSSWYSVSKSDARVTDFAVVLLDQQLQGYFFRLAPRSPLATQRVVGLGYSLGNALSLNQGRVISRTTRSGVPVIDLNLLGAHGSSGGPILNLNGQVVGLTQRGATNGSYSLVESLNLARFINGRPASLCQGVAKGQTSTLCGVVSTTPKSGTAAGSSGGSSAAPPPAVSTPLDVADGWFSTASSADPTKKLYEAGAVQGTVYLILKLNRVTTAGDPANISVRILKPDGSVYGDQSYPPQDNSPFQLWSLSINLAGPGSAAPMGGTWTAEASVDGSQPQTFALNVVRLPDPFAITLTPDSSFNPAYTFAIYLGWRLVQEVPQGDTFTAELVSPSGAVKSTTTFISPDTLGAWIESLYPGSCFTNLLSNTSTCEYGQWTVDVRRNGAVIWSAGLQAAG